MSVPKRVIKFYYRLDWAFGLCSWVNKSAGYGLRELRLIRVMIVKGIQEQAVLHADAD